LIRDRDAIFGKDVIAITKGMGVEEVVTHHAALRASTRTNENGGLDRLETMGVDLPAKHEAGFPLVLLEARL